MQKAELLERLKQTLSDFRLSRGEKKTIKAVVNHYFQDAHDMAVLRAEAFDIARSEIGDEKAGEVVGWLEEVVKILIPSNAPKSNEAEAVFSTEHNCVTRLQNLIALSDKSLDICVFTITDDRITEEIMDAVKRRVKVRIISDDEKANDPGSDIYRMIRQGIEVRTDRDPNHMHHKFAIFDNQKLLNGSYNWTRSAARGNEENFVICDDPKLIGQFSGHFEKLWKEFS